MKNIFRIDPKNVFLGLFLLSLLTRGQAAVIPGVTINAVSSEYTSGGDLRRATNMLMGVGLFGDVHTAVAPGSMWLTLPTTTGSVTNAFVTFDLGSVHSVSQMKVWNYNESGVNTQRGIQRADISIAGEDLLFTTNLANALFTRAPGTFTNFAQSFDFAGASARYVRINIKTNYYVSGTAENRVGLSKVQFIDNTVPPTLKLVTRSFTGDRVTVQFSESVSSSTATNTANYSISDGTNIVTVLSAAMGTFNDVVTLKTATLNSNVLYTLTVQNVFDAANIISVSTTSLPIEPELVVWLKGDVGVTADGSGFISQWADQSGAGNHAIQITNGVQPTVSSDPVSGQPTLHFDGSTQMLEITNNSSLIANRDLSLYLVMSADVLVSTATANGQSPISVCPTNVPGSFDLQVTRTAGKIQFLRGNGSGNNSITGPGALSANQNYIVSVVMQGTNATEYINGSFNGTASLAAGIAQSGNSIRLGIRQDRATTFKGSLAEVMVVRGALTDAEQTTLNNYLGVKYGISVVSLGITGQPENATRLVGETATFAVSTVSGYSTLLYQWQKGTNNISGATNSTYKTPTLSLADNNSTYRVIVTTPIGLSTNSTAATLTVLADTQAPTVFSAVQKPGSTTNIVVTFSESVASAGATLVSNYSLNNGATVISAAMGSSTNQVILTTSVIDTNVTYSLTVRNVQDLFNNTLVTTTVIVFPSTLSLWVRADSGVNTNSAGQVSEWLDQSGNQNHASQFGMPSLRPTMVSAAMNGHSVLRFDGASNYVQAASSPTLAITNDLTVYAVVNVSDYASARHILGKTAGNQPSSYDYYIPPTTPTRLYRGNGIGVNGFFAATASPSAGSAHILSFTMRGTNVAHYLDGKLNGSGVLNTNMADTGNPLRIGSRNDLAQYMKGDIAETFIFSSALSTNDRQAVDTYLGFKYLPFSIAPQPQSVSKLEGETATFTVGATAGSAFFGYQWKRNLSNIPGATNATYTTPVLTLGNNNDTYLAVISLPDGTTTNSDTATLTVSADTVSPTILSAGLKLWNKTQLVVTFSEAVNLSMATNLANYTLDNGGIITAAVLGDTPNTIVLTVSGLDPSTLYSLTVQNIQDLFGNTIVPTPAALGVYPSSLALWLKADAGITVDGQNLVTSWADQSGKGNNAHQVTPDTAPLFVTNAFNNLPVLNFNGTNQYLVVDHAASLAITGDISVYTVVRIRDFTSTANEIGLLGKSGGATGNQPAPYDYYLTKTTGLPRFYRGNGTVNGTLLATTAPSTNGLHSLSVIMAGTAATHYLDGKTNGSGTISTTIADYGNPMGIGTRYDLRPKMNGDIAEVLLFSSALSDSDRQMLDSYLANKYAILNSPLFLAVESTAPTLNMAWPVTPLSLVLETTLNLSSTNWVAVTNPVSTVGGTNKVSVSTGTGSQFYRLRKP